MRAWPEISYIGDTRIRTTLANYLDVNFEGLTAYGCNSTETFYFSATPGQDSYTWSIGDYTQTTARNTLRIPVSSQTAITPLPISVKITNDLFDEGTPNNDYNYVQFSEDLTFLPFPSPLFSPQINGSFFSLNNEPLPGLRLEWITDYTNTPFAWSSGVGQITVSSEDDEHTVTLPIQPNIPTVLPFSLSDPSSPMFVPENTSKDFKLILNGTLDVNLVRDSRPSCSVALPEEELTFTAFHGPKFLIHATKNYGTVGEVLIFTNQTSLDNTAFQTLHFDDGNGIQEASAIGDELSATYMTEGNQTVVLSAYYSMDEPPEIITFNNFFHILPPPEEYNPALNREPLETLVLPNNCNTIGPNEFISADRFNTWVGGVVENLQYIKNKSQMVSYNFPIHQIAWLGNHSTSVSRWNYVDDYQNRIVVDDTMLSDAVDIRVDSSWIFVVTPKEIRIYTNTFRPQHLTTIGGYSLDEIFYNISAFHYDSQTQMIYVIDNVSNNLFIFHWDAPTVTPVFYFSGKDHSTSSQRFLNTRDILTTPEYIFIADTGRNIVRIYNKFLNSVDVIDNKWTKNNTQPINLSIAEDKLYVLLNNNTVEVFDRYSFSYINTITLKISNSIGIHANAEDVGIIYVVGSDGVYKYLENGVEASLWDVPAPLPKISQIGKEIFVPIANNAVLKLTDYYSTVGLRDMTHDHLLWNPDQIRVLKDEGVQNWVYNDILNKLVDNINILYNSFEYEYVFTLSPRTEQPESAALQESAFSPKNFDRGFTFGINEQANAYGVWNRVQTTICSYVNDVLFRAQSKTRRSACETFCWAWNSLMLGTNEAPNCQTNPVSWEELKCGSVLNFPKTWNDLRDDECCGPANKHSLRLPWNQLMCGMPYGLSWDDLACDGWAARSWIDMTCTDSDEGPRSFAPTMNLNVGCDW
jgi:hypothetical protein